VCSSDLVLQDDETMRFVKAQGAQATWVTSVCTGAFVLGAAGLLRGRRATTHWAWHHLLPRVGAIPVQARVVRDGNVFTGGGVTAGIDFALTVAAELAGEAVARNLQLGIEYDPAPPFDGGHPSRARPESVEALRGRYAKRLEAFERLIS
jgi:cyclohexyl-isocyanide hydratase